MKDPQLQLNLSVPKAAKKAAKTAPSARSAPSAPSAPARAEGPAINPEECVTAYTDGGCDPNPGPGGWGAVLRYKNKSTELSGGDMKTTNNRMELTAAISALDALKRPCVVKLHTDSQYVQKGITSWINGWKRNGWVTKNKEPVLNKELWQRLDELCSRHTVQWQWVKAHVGIPDNERADQLATLARCKMTGQPVPPPRVPGGGRFHHRGKGGRR